MSEYELQPGTLSFRAVAYLRGLPRGAELSSSELAEALEQPASALVPALQAPVRHGMIISERRDRLRYWRLPRSQSEAEAAKRAIEAAAGSQWPNRRPRALTVAQEARAAAQGAANDKPERGQAHGEDPPNPANGVPTQASPAIAVKRGEDVATAVDRVLSVALWSDGRLWIERGADVLRLSPEEARQLVAYLDRMAEAEEC